MASYVDNSFRQAVMMNPAERTQQVRGIIQKCYRYFIVKTFLACFDEVTWVHSNNDITFPAVATPSRHSYIVSFFLCSQN